MSEESEKSRAEAMKEFVGAMFELETETKEAELETETETESYQEFIKAIKTNNDVLIENLSDKFSYIIKQTHANSEQAKILSESSKAQHEMTQLIISKLYEQQDELDKTKLISEQLKAEIVKNKKRDYKQILAMKLILVVMMFAFFIAGMTFNGFSSNNLDLFTTSFIGLGVFALVFIFIALMYKSIFSKLSNKDI